MRRSSTGLGCPGARVWSWGAAVPQAPCPAAPNEGERAGWDLRGPSRPGGRRGNGAQEREGDLPKVQVDPRPLSPRNLWKIPWSCADTESHRATEQRPAEWPFTGRGQGGCDPKPTGRNDTYSLSFECGILPRLGNSPFFFHFPSIERGAMAVTLGQAVPIKHSLWTCQGRPARTADLQSLHLAPGPLSPGAKLVEKFCIFCSRRGGAHWGGKWSVPLSSSALLPPRTFCTLSPI